MPAQRVKTYISTSNIKLQIRVYTNHKLYYLYQFQKSDLPRDSSHIQIHPIHQRDTIRKISQSDQSPVDPVDDFTLLLQAVSLIVVDIVQCGHANAFDFAFRCGFFAAGGLHCGLLVRRSL